MARAVKTTFTVTLFILVTLVALSCYAFGETPASDGAALKDLAANPGTFDSVSESTVINYTLVNVSNAHAELDIYNRFGTQVAT
ncbi:MAG TPA: hypothetical protein VLT35_06570, partial [Methanocella sp.]|nr:hypothetical protein [Methanocella sp.]